MRPSTGAAVEGYGTSSVLKATSSGRSVGRLPRRDVLVDEVQGALLVVARSTTQVRVHERLLRSAGVRLDRAGAALLHRLAVRGDALRVSELAEALGVDSPTVTRKVQQLERDGLVTRETDPTDRRATRIKLRPAGRRTLERVLRARRQWLEGLLAEWDDADLAAFGSLLERFSAVLERELDGNGGA